MLFLPRLFLPCAAALVALWMSGCASSPTSSTAGRTPGVRSALLPPGVHGRLTGRTMRPRYITIHSTENRGGTAAQHAQLLLGKGLRSKNGPRFGRSGWVNWHYTVDDREAVQHLLPTEEADHADYGGLGDRASIGIEICEFSSPARQAAAIDRGARLAAQLADRYGIPTRNIVPHHHWPRWDFKYGKPCPRILLQRGSSPDGWVEGEKWRAFLAKIDRYR
ncbi:peptidoglycan recognition protein family protein [Verrucomicrobiota bacterium sgz303538]